MRTPTFPLYDEILNGRLEELLRKWRSEGRTLREIPALMDEALPSTVSAPSHQLVARWCIDLDIPDPRAAA